jgi:hypothetical protein
MLGGCDVDAVIHLIHREASSSNYILYLLYH